VLHREATKEDRPPIAEARTRGSARWQHLIGAALAAHFTKLILFCLEFVVKKKLRGVVRLVMNIYFGPQINGTRFH
jgi:hypothetical protein